MTTNHTNFIRVAALGHNALGMYRVKVIFREGGYKVPKGAECAYWMTAETYHEYPLGEEHTLKDYQDKGECVEASNTDVYSDQ